MTLEQEERMEAAKAAELASIRIDSAMRLVRSRLIKNNGHSGTYMVAVQEGDTTTKHKVEVNDPGFFSGNRKQRRTFEKQQKLKAKQQVWNQIKKQLEDGKQIRLPTDAEILEGVKNV